METNISSLLNRMFNEGKYIKTVSISLETQFLHVFVHILILVFRCCLRQKQKQNLFAYILYKIDFVVNVIYFYCKRIIYFFI